MYPTFLTSSCNSMLHCSEKPFRLEDIDEEWRTDKTSILKIQLLTRGLKGCGFGAVHTTLLFETNSKYLIVEYGDNGIDITSYLKNKIQLGDALQNTMGKMDYIYVYNMTECFDLSNLKLNDIYFKIDDLKDIYNAKSYIFLTHNCRKFVKDICQNLGCNREGLMFLSSFKFNLPLFFQIILPCFTIPEKLFYHGLNDKYEIGYWDLKEKEFVATKFY